MFFFKGLFKLKWFIFILGLKNMKLLRSIIIVFNAIFKEL